MNITIICSINRIICSSPGNIIIGNSASKNPSFGPTTNYLIVAGNATGTIIDVTGGGEITSGNPWANFEF